MASAIAQAPEQRGDKNARASGFRQHGRTMEAGRVLLARITREYDEWSAARTELACHGFGSLVVAKIDIEDSDVAAVIPNQPKRFVHRNCRTNDLKTCIRELSGDVECDQGVVLDHQHTSVNVWHCPGHVTANPLAPPVFKIRVVGQFSRQMSPDGAKSS